MLFIMLTAQCWLFKASWNRRNEARSWWIKQPVLLELRDLESKGNASVRHDRGFRFRVKLPRFRFAVFSKAA